MHKMLLMSAALVAGLMMGTPAQAAINVDVKGDIPAVDKGSWHATLTNISGNTWKVRVVANSGLQTPNSVADTISLAFYNVTNPYSYVNPGANTINIASAGPAGVNAPLYNNWNSSATNIPNDHYVNFDTSSSANFLLNNGSNAFEGIFTLDEEFKSFDIRVQDSKHWSALGVNVVPEPSALALALPGLLPFAGLVLRRRKNDESEDESEGEEA
jgi:hypothetical protein